MKEQQELKILLFFKEKIAKHDSNQAEYKNAYKNVTIAEMGKTQTLK
jgi:hypothetical protein